MPTRDIPPQYQYQNANIAAWAGLAVRYPQSPGGWLFDQTTRRYWRPCGPDELCGGSQGSENDYYTWCHEHGHHSDSCPEVDEDSPMGDQIRAFYAAVMRGEGPAREEPVVPKTKKAKPYSKVIQAVGVELEGGWKYERFYNINDRRVELGVSIPGDGSVHIYEADAHEFKRTEMVPLKPFETPAEASEWIRKFYPDVVPTRWAIDDNCGYHIHISFRTLRMYQSCMCRKFFDDCYKFWTDWGRSKLITQEKPFWHRLNGESQFCKPSYKPDEQARAEEKIGSLRYSGLNYCFGLHGTMELRLLPMFDTADEAIEALAAWVGFVDTWLAAYKEPKVENKLTIDLSGVRTGYEDLSPEPVQVTAEEGGTILRQVVTHTIREPVIGDEFVEVEVT